MAILMALVSGLLFGAGLAVAQMNNPQKILNFLDVASISRGGWDPTMLMVFIGALPVMFMAYQLQRRRSAPWFDTAFSVPVDETVDRSLVGGSVMFGIGWGLVGLCPGPAIIGLTLASKEVFGPALLFFGAMLCGVWLAYVLGFSGSRVTRIAV
jgi:uncharacterized protein